MAEVYLLLGSNEGKPEENLRAARWSIEQECGAINLQSGWYQTQAWGLKEQPDFLNQAIQITTEIKPIELLRILKQIETRLGRIETIKWGPRVIDIDILFYDHQVVDLPELKIPHPFIQDRRFTLAPMAEIAPAFVHPVLKKTMMDLLKECEDGSEVRLKTI